MRNRNSRIGRDIYKLQDERSKNLDNVVRPSYNMYESQSSGVPNTYERTALKGQHTETTLNQVFFSEANIDIIQNAIRKTVWEKTNNKHVIGRQSNTELVIVMRAIFFQHAKNLPTGIKDQIKDLNQLVVNDVVPNIIVQIEQYLKYLENKAQIPDPIPRSLNVSSAGTKTLRSVTSTF